MHKYYYQQGRCEANHYLSLNPVLCESTEEKDKYKKVKMACSLIQEGKCDRVKSCQLFKDAPEYIIDDKTNLHENKLGE